MVPYCTFETIEIGNPFDIIWKPIPVPYCTIVESCRCRAFYFWNMKIKNPPPGIIIVNFRCFGKKNLHVRGTGIIENSMDVT